MSNPSKGRGEVKILSLILQSLISFDLRVIILDYHLFYQIEDLFLPF